MGQPNGAGILYTIPKLELEYHIPSQIPSWNIIYPPKIRGHYVPSQGMYWYILGQNLGPWPRIQAQCRPLAVSNRAHTIYQYMSTVLILGQNFPACPNLGPIWFAGIGIRKTLHFIPRAYFTIFQTRQSLCRLSELVAPPM